MPLSMKSTAAVNQFFGDCFLHALRLLGDERRQADANEDVCPSIIEKPQKENPSPEMALHRFTVVLTLDS
ncbi:hypothetical protein F2P79_006358 [Pimephales promelas]|nr:hypothetical protein F2P79_006358 [Pimephales promelas]